MPRQIVFVTRKFPPSIGGMQTLAGTVWTALSHVSPDAILVAHRGGNRALALWLPRAVLRVATLVAKRSVDVVLVGDALMYGVLFPILRLGGVRSVVMVHGLDITYRNPLYRAFVLPALRRAPRVLANSAATASVARTAGVPADRIVVVPPVIEAPPVTAADRADAARRIRARFGIDPDAFVLLTVGRLVERKGVRWFVREVLPHLPADVVYLVAGDGPDSSAIADQAAAASTTNRLHLLGRVSDEVREDLLRGADVFIQPNVPVPADMEGFGLVIAEATLRGTPAVASAIEGILDAIEDGITGMLLPALDAGAWVEVLTRLGRDRDELARMGARFQLNAQPRFAPPRLEADLATALAE